LHLLRSSHIAGSMKRGQFCGPGQIFINEKLAASGEWKGVQLIKSFNLDSDLIRKIEADVGCAEQAGLSANLAAAKDELPPELCQVKLVEDCRLAALANNAAELDAARRARALKQVVSRPSSSLSVAQDLLDVDQALPVCLDFSSPFTLTLSAFRRIPVHRVMKMMAMLKMATAARLTACKRLTTQSTWKVQQLCL
jgi:hypothetical protein